MIYFDNAATSYPKPDCVIEAVKEAFEKAGNSGRGAHEMALWSARVLYEAREQTARLLRAEPTEIVFTPNATMALNEAIAQVEGPILTTVMEHNSVLRPCHRRGNYQVVKAVDGILSAEKVIAAITDDIKAVVMTHASNLTGEIYDIGKVGQVCREKDILFVVDAAQTAGVVPIDVREMSVDMLAFAGHKGTMGPTGTGGLYVGSRVKPRSFLYGGTGSKSHELSHPQMMPDVLEAGTQNIHGLAGLSAGIEWVLETGVEKILKHEQELAAYFIQKVSELGKIDIYRKDCQRTGTVAVNLPGIDSSEVCDWLAEEGFCVRGGAHCAPLAHESLGTQSLGAVRFSFGYQNTLEEIDQCMIVLKNILDASQRV